MKTSLSWPRGRDPVSEHRSSIVPRRQGQDRDYRGRRASGFGRERMRASSSDGFCFLISPEECPKLILTYNYSQSLRASLSLGPSDFLNNSVPNPLDGTMPGRPPRPGGGVAQSETREPGAGGVHSWWGDPAWMVAGRWLHRWGRTVAVVMGKWLHLEDADPINKYMEDNGNQIS